MQTFSIHKDLLTLHSGYFDHRLRGAEDDHKLELFQTTPSTFVTFHSWLYTGDAFAIG
jgi:hypothetical protein